MKTRSRVLAALCVAKERARTDGRVEEAGGVGKERIRTNGRVVDAGCEAEKRILTLRCVVARITSVGCGRDRLNRLRRRNQGERKSK